MLRYVSLATPATAILPIKDMYPINMPVKKTLNKQPQAKHPNPAPPVSQTIKNTLKSCQAHYNPRSQARKVRQFSVSNRVNMMERMETRRTDGKLIWEILKHLRN